MSTAELPPRAAHTVETFDGAVIGRNVEGKCRNCWDAGVIDDGDRVALYVKERKPTNGTTVGPKGYELLSLWHRRCAPEIGTRTLDEYLLAGTLARCKGKESETDELLEDVELIAYSPAESGVDLLATDDEPVNDTRQTTETAADGGACGETRENETRSGENKPSNPRVNASQSAEDGGFTGVLAGELGTFEHDGVRLERAETDAPIYHAHVDGEEGAVTLNVAGFATAAQLRREVEDLGDPEVEGEERITPGDTSAYGYADETRDGGAEIYMNVDYSCDKAIFMSFLDRELYLAAQDLGEELERRYREIDAVEVKHTGGSS